jgi:integrase
VNYESLSFPTEDVLPEARFFTLEEVGKIIATAATAREPYKTMFMLLAMTGMRAGEVLGLQWQDIDCDRSLVNIRRSAWYGRTQTVKNKTSEGVVPLPEVLAKALRDYRVQWKANPNGFLFVTRNSEGHHPPTRSWSMGCGRS